MKKWFMENGFEEINGDYTKNLNVTDDGLRFWISYDSFNNNLNILKIFKNYDITYREMILTEKSDIPKTIKQFITDMKTYLTFDECEHLYLFGFLDESYINDMRWFREL